MTSTTTIPAVALAPADAPSSGDRLQTLDGMRGIAALAVAAYHADYLFGRGIFPSSYLAVDLFFILSGFVISRAYGGKLEAGLSVARFMAIRVHRLYPLYFLGVALALPLIFVWLSKGSYDWLSVAIIFASAILFLPSPVGTNNGTAYPLNGPAWSLLFELLANLMAACVWRHLDIRRLAVGLMLASLLLVWVGFSNGSLNGGVGWGTFYVASARVLFGFFAGVLLQKLPFRLPRFSPLLLVALLIPIFLADPSKTLRPFYDLGVALVVFPAMVALGAQATPVGWVGGLFAYAGQVSYPLYVLHTPVFRMYRTVGKAWIEPGIAAGLLALAVAIVGAAIADRMDAAVRKRLPLSWPGKRLRQVEP